MDTQQRNDGAHPTRTAHLGEMVSNPNKQVSFETTLTVGVKLPPIPKSLALDTPGVESRIRLGDIPADQIREIAKAWSKAFVAEAKEQKKQCDK